MSTTPSPNFNFITNEAYKGVYKQGGGGYYILRIDDRNLCDFEYWGFASCAMNNLYGFKNYQYQHKNSTHVGRTNFSLIEEHHASLFEWLKKHSPIASYNAKEFYMLLSPPQVLMLPKTLKHPYVKEIDRFKNKAHDGNFVRLYRISLEQDFNDCAKLPIHQAETHVPVRSGVAAKSKPAAATQPDVVAVPG